MEDIGRSALRLALSGPDCTSPTRTILTFSTWTRTACSVQGACSVPASPVRFADGYGDTNTYNLSNKIPSYDGHVLRDDGTNLAPGEYAYADTDNTVWRAFSDPTNSTVNY